MPWEEMCTTVREQGGSVDWRCTGTVPPEYKVVSIRFPDLDETINVTLARSATIDFIWMDFLRSDFTEHLKMATKKFGAPTKTGTMTLVTYGYGGMKLPNRWATWEAKDGCARIIEMAEDSERPGYLENKGSLSIENEESCLAETRIRKKSW
jgi:hypothetical protein